MGISFSKRLKGKIWLGMLYAFIIANIADFLTALPVLGAETNPTYVLTGSIWGMVFGKVFVIAIFYVMYRMCFLGSRFHAYTFSIMMVWLTFILVMFGAIGNIAVWSQPDVFVAYSQASGEQKISHYNRFVISWFYLPICIMMLAYPVIVSGFQRSEEKTKRNV